MSGRLADREGKLVDTGGMKDFYCSNRDLKRITSKDTEASLGLKRKSDRERKHNNEFDEWSAKERKKNAWSAIKHGKGKSPVAQKTVSRLSVVAFLAMLAFILTKT